MKTISPIEGMGSERNGLLELALMGNAGRQARKRAAGNGRPSQAMQLELDGSSLWRFAGDLHGLRLVCRRGRLWVTQAGIAQDVILQPGQSLVAAARGEVVVQSVPASAEVPLVDVFADAANSDGAVRGFTLAPAGNARIKILREQKVSLYRMSGLEAARTGTWENSVYLALFASSLLALALAFWS